MKNNLWKIIVSIVIIIGLSLVLINTALAPSDSNSDLNIDTNIDTIGEEHPNFEKTKPEIIDVDIIYVDVAENTEKTKAIKIEDNEKLIAEEVVKAIGDKGTKINCVHTLQKEYISIDFTDDSTVLHTGTAGELAVLDSLTKTFENLGYQKVYFTVEDSQYVSGHMEMELPPYLIEVGEFD